MSPPPNEDDDSLMGADSQLLKIIAEESSESDDSLEITVHDEDTSQSSELAVSTCDYQVTIM